MSYDDAQHVCDLVIRRSMDETIPDVMFSDLKPMIEGGVGRQRILQTFPNLTPKKVFKAQGFFNAKVKARPDKTNYDGLHILCDENISIQHLRSCQHLFDYATSIAFENMLARSDQDVWDYALGNGFDLIVTQDRRNRDHTDLTRIAVNAWRAELQNADDGFEKIVHFPMVVQLTGKAKHCKKFGMLTAEALTDIFTARADLAGPVLRLNDAGLHRVVRAFSLLHDMPERPIVKTSRTASWARRYLAAVLPDRNLWRERTPQIMAIKRKINRAVTIASRARQERAATFSAA